MCGYLKLRVKCASTRVSLCVVTIVDMRLCAPPHIRHQHILFCFRSSSYRARFDLLKEQADLVAFAQKQPQFELIFQLMSEGSAMTGYEGKQRLFQRLLGPACPSMHWGDSWLLAA